MGLILKTTEYIKYIEMSKSKHLLVEGRTDKKVFEALLDDLFEQGNQDKSRGDIDIETAEDLVKDDADPSAGNREKVELICLSVDGTPYADKIVGFVDREFREFEKSDVLRDKLNRHKTIGRLVWSRGHSIENYYFDSHILHKSFKLHSNTDFHERAINRFQEILNQAINLACAFGLLAIEFGEIKALKGMIDWKLITITDAEVNLNFSLFKRKLMERPQFVNNADILIDHLRVWNERVSQSETSCIRWMCHGHIGFKFLISVYARCVYEACLNAGIRSRQAETELRNKVLDISEDRLFSICAIFWIQKLLKGQCDYPVDVLRFLGLSVPNENMPSQILTEKC